MKSPSARGIPEEADWEEYVRAIALRAAGAEQAIALFDDGELDVVLGGRIGALPLADTGPLSRGTIRIDPALGLFGLQVRRAQGLLGTAPGREAVAMALDRPQLIAAFNIGGWVPTTRVVAPDLPGDPGYVGERWTDSSVEDLRAVAAGRVAAWRRSNNDAAARLTVALADGPGFDLLFRELAAQLAAIGVQLERVGESAPADLVLVDRVARYADPRWFLNQFNCSLRNGLCDSDADMLVEQAMAEIDPIARATLLAEAESALTLSNLYIPFGSPLRFSLVRSDVDGFAANAWAFHPLPPLAQVPR
jgi:oligopeptide transport system substrate-binding protein